MSRFLHWTGQALCFLLLLILIPLSVVTVWTRATVVDRSRYLSAVGPLAENRAVQAEATNIVMAYLDRLAAESDSNSSELLQELSESYASVRAEIESAVQSAVASSQFETIWRHSNESVHSTLIALLKGKDLGAVQTSNGVVRLDLAELFREVQSALQRKGITTLDGIEPGNEALSMTIFKSDDLATAQSWMRFFDRGTIAIAALTIIISVLFLWVSTSIWRGLFWLAVIVAVTMAALFIGIRVGRDATAGSISNASGRAAAVAIYDGVLKSLRAIVIWSAGGAAIVAVIIFLSSRLQRLKPI